MMIGSQRFGKKKKKRDKGREVVFRVEPAIIVLQKATTTQCYVYVEISSTL